MEKVYLKKGNVPADYVITKEVGFQEGLETSQKKKYNRNNKKTKRK